MCNPTIIIIVDRIDLDTQISGTFHAANAPNLTKAESRQELQTLLTHDARKIIITTIFKFAEIQAPLTDRQNIIVLVDEAHRTQEGDLGRKLRTALPHAFLFGLTGTPINRTDRNTFHTFSAEQDTAGYLSRYSFEDSVRDGATKKLHFESRLVDLRIDRIEIEKTYKQLTTDLTPAERDRLTKATAKIAVLLKTPDRITTICTDIAQHYQQKVAPNNFGAQIVAIDREGCLLYKQELDRHLPAQLSDIVISVNNNEDRYIPYHRDREQEKKLLDRFRDPHDPLKILIVTSKLLTGFDAPILQTMYLDKPMRDHTLLQAICRTNRPHGPTKTHGLIVDYIGVFDDAVQALRFDEQNITQVASNIRELHSQLPDAVQKCLAYFDDIDRTLTGYEGLIAAQERLPDNQTRDLFAADCTRLTRLWEAIAPDPILNDYETDYGWLLHIYESVKPTTNTGQLLWRKLGPQTIALIQRNVHVAAIRDDLETLVLDDKLLETLRDIPNPKQTAHKIEIKITTRLRNRAHDPRFKALAERLENLKNRHEQGLVDSVEFLKDLFHLAKDVVAAEKTTPVEKEEHGRNVLTALFEEASNARTPVIVARVVNDIDEVVRNTRFNDWQNTNAGRREIRSKLRKTLHKYELHLDQELFEKAYGYIAQYY